TRATTASKNAVRASTVGYRSLGRSTCSAMTPSGSKPGSIAWRLTSVLAISAVPIRSITEKATSSVTRIDGERPNDDRTGAAGAGDDQAFDQHAGDQPAAARAERRADRHLAQTERGVRQEQTGDVGAGDEQHE